MRLLQLGVWSLWLTHHSICQTLWPQSFWAPPAICVCLCVCVCACNPSFFSCLQVKPQHILPDFNWTLFLLVKGSLASWGGYGNKEIKADTSSCTKEILYITALGDSITVYLIDLGWSLNWHLNLCHGVAPSGPLGGPFYLLPISYYNDLIMICPHK